MRGLRTIRIILSVVFLTATVASLVFGLTANPMSKATERLQIIPALTSLSLGVVLFWIAATLLMGRIYCSSVCPVGTVQDAILWLRRKTRRNHTFSYRPARRVRLHILIFYAVCLVVGVSSITYWLDPWSLMRSFCAPLNPEGMQGVWAEMGIGAASGMIAGGVSFLVIAVCAFCTGRGFCTVVCPLGTAMGCLSNLTVWHIEIDPDKCINCMKCEEVCKSHCVKVVGRFVDDSRCVRCFDCTDVCPNNAIRLQANRNRRVTPLFRKSVSN